MAGWYKNRVVDHIDVNQAVRDAGKRGEAIALMAQGVKNYADTVYTKERAKVADAQKAAANATKKYVADKGYAGKVDSARIRASASDRRNAASIKVAGINFNREKYKSDKAYRKAVDQEMLRNKGKAITAKAKIKSAAISAGGKIRAAKIGYQKGKYVADTNMKRTKLASKTQLEVADKYKERDKAKTQAKIKIQNTKATAKKLKDFEGMSDEEIIKKLGNKNKNIADMTISF